MEHRRATTKAISVVLSLDSKKFKYVHHLQHMIKYTKQHRNECIISKSVTITDYLQKLELRLN